MIKYTREPTDIEALISGCIKVIQIQHAKIHVFIIYISIVPDQFGLIDPVIANIKTENFARTTIFGTKSIASRITGNVEK